MTTNTLVKTDASHCMVSQSQNKWTKVHSSPLEFGTHQYP